VAAAASASTGAPVYSPEQAGYAATGAHFKVAEVWVKLPDASRFAHELGSLSVSVQLWTAASVMDLRASACTDTTCRPGGKPVTRRYHLDFTVFSRSTGAPVCSTSNKTCPGVPASWNSARFAPGRTMALSLFYDPKAGSFFASANSQSYDNYFPGPGLIFNQARIGVETGATPWSRTPFRAPAVQVRLATFGIPPGPAQAAEIAVTVIDGWQGRGLGTELLARLSERACQEGIRRFTAAVAADNAPMTGLLRNLGADVVGREFGTLEYELALACVPARRARFRGNAPGRVGLS
jgi:RimJ/RimL family protein N-acetyltransferase